MATLLTDRPLSAPRGESGFFSALAPRGKAVLFARVYVPRVAPFSVAAKPGEFRLELAESRRIVPEWTSIRTLGHRRGSRGGSNWSGDPPSLVARKRTPPLDPPEFKKFHALRGCHTSSQWSAANTSLPGS